MSKTEARITLAVDAMGGDQGPQEILAGVSKAVDVSPRNTHFVLFGQEDVLGPIVEHDLNLNSNQVSVRHAPEIVGMDEKPIADQFPQVHLKPRSDRVPLLPPQKH